MPIQGILEIYILPYVSLLEVAKSQLNSDLLRGFTKVLIRQTDKLLQSIVYILTFLLYSNDVRFRWAYSGDDIESSKLIQTPTIKLAVAISGVIYLVSSVANNKYINKKNNYLLKAGDPLVDRLERKLYFVLFVIILISICSIFYKKVFDESKYLKFNTYLTNYKKEKDWKNIKQRNFNNNNLFKKADIEVQKRDLNSDEPFRDKYYYIDHWKEGLGIFTIYSFIGLALPFLPSKMIYSDYEIQNASWFKFSIVLIIIVLFIGGIFFLCQYGVSLDKLKLSEKLLLLEMKESTMIAAEEE